MSDPERETDVLMVGGGPTGLTAGIELGTRDIDTVILEPRTSVSHNNPRAKTTNIRSMEHFRRLGIADRVRDAANLPVEWSQEAVFCTSLIGHEICRFDRIHGLQPNGSDDFAEPGQQIPQFLVEEVLRERVKELSSVTFSTGWRLDSLTQDERGVHGVAVSDHGRREITAAYAIGSDGAKSAVREQIGSEYQGERNPRENLGTVFSAPDLAETHQHGPAVHYWIINESVQALLGHLDPDDRWWGIIVGVENAERADPQALLQEAIGESVELKILGTEPWSAYMLLVDDARVGRTFLAGDAAHLNPPWGGLGYNTGVADAVDIGWKLAAVLNGWGNSDLLKSYEQERRPIWTRLIEETTNNMETAPADLVVPNIAADGEVGEEARESAAEHIQSVKKSEFYNNGIVLGYRYDGSPIVIEDEKSPPPKDVVEYNPTSYPGARVPHMWLTEEKSLYDTFGQGFSLLSFDPEIDLDPFVRAAEKRGLPLETITVPLPEEQYQQRYEFPLIFVRPDQHVAWRGESCPDNVASVLEQVR
jgi:2-polyprenyl-6-methoxyphenol hydroxylase-like FAD-dependent oxidoreductase